MSRLRDQNVTNFVKNVNILEFGYYILNPYEKCIQKSPNMPGIGSLIHEIDVKISQIWETNKLFLLSKTNIPAFYVLSETHYIKIAHVAFTLLQTLNLLHLNYFTL